jgi:hypothetical protein
MVTSPRIQDLLVGFSVVAGLVFCPAHLSAQGKVQKISKNLVKRVDDTIKEIEKTEKQLKKAVRKYDDLLGKKKVKDRQKEYKNLQKELDKTEDRAKDVRKRSENMQKESDKFFKEWAKGLNKIDDPQLRAMSREALNGSQTRYGEITQHGFTAADRYDRFVADVENQLQYLQIDMSDESMAKLEDHASVTKASASELFTAIGDLKKTMRGYVQSMK